MKGDMNLTNLIMSIITSYQALILLYVNINVEWHKLISILVISHTWFLHGYCILKYNNIGITTI